MDKWLRRVGIAATIVMFLVMIGGSLVTKTGSALGCGNDWPLCNGKFVPEYTLESIVEYMHRLVTGLAGIVVLVFVIMAWRRYPRNRQVRALSVFAGFFLIVESLLGASAVMWPQSPPVMALHFGLSLLAFAGVFLLMLFVLQREKEERLVSKPVSAGFRRYVWAVTIYAYGVVYIGAYVRHTNASLACPDWPLCRGSLIPELSGLVAVQFFHRVCAAILFFLILGIVTYAVRHYKGNRRDVYKASILALILVGIQVLSGGWVVYSRLIIYATLFHSAVITCLFGVLCYLCLQALKQPQDSKQEKSLIEPNPSAVTWQKV
ncbi:COX15/CtaA family protein [Brevibacillus sp. B_LB10_24]|uniref:COX15/CtaA family protein n=1 Tax=Brevibacillus sp. B_LB10_24 TaxID=3380645 RepID=UPI0038BA66E0